MSCDTSQNDAVLHPYLMEDDSAESERHLILLLSEYAEPRIKSIVISRLRSFPYSNEHCPDYEDVLSEAKTRLLTYLSTLKDRLVEPCNDFLSYVGGTAHIACSDYFRQRYPARARLYKSIRDQLNSNPEFAIWKAPDKRGGEWLCGFASYPDGESPDDRLAADFPDKRDDVIHRLSATADMQLMKTVDLVRAVFQLVENPIRVADLVEFVAELRGVKDLPAFSLDVDGAGNWLSLSDSRARIDSILEMREPLERYWKALCALPRKELSAYLLYARDTTGEDLISLLIWAKLASERQVAALLGISLERFREISQGGLPLDNQRIATELGVKIERVYKLRNNAGNRIERFLADTNGPEK